MGAHLRNTAQRERSRAFDSWVENTAHALRNPAVSQRLGAIGTRLLAANEQAFLPNVRHGVVSVPWQYKGTDGTCILPRLHTDETLQPRRTLLLPTPNRREKMATALQQSGHLASGRAVDKVVNWAIADDSQDEDNGVYAHMNKISAAGTLSAAKYIQAANLLFTSRPLIVLSHGGLASHSSIKGAVGSHELVHAIDREDAMDELDIYFQAKTELRGYRVSGVIVEEALRAGVLSSDEADRDDSFTPEVEEIRKQFGIDPDLLLNGDLPFNEDNGAVDELVTYLLTTTVFDASQNL